MINKKGFTLFEILVTIAVTMILFAMASSATITVSRTHSALRDRHEANTELSRIFTRVAAVIESYNSEGQTLFILDGRLYTDLEGDPVLRFDTEAARFCFIAASSDHPEACLPLDYIENITFSVLAGSVEMTVQRLDRTPIRKLYHVTGSVQDE